jgi:putative transport protein
LRPRAGFRFRWGDRIQVSVPADRADDLRALVGDDIRGLEEMAFPRAALVIFVGGMVGAVPIHLGGGGSVRLGSALGVLVASLVTAALHRTGPMVWTQSGPTSRLMAHISLPLFMAQIGNASYAGLVASWEEYGLRLIQLSLGPILLAVPCTFLAGRWSGSGALTTLSLLPSLALNTPALTMIQKSYREAIPGHVYASVYPFVAIGLLWSMFLLSLAV